MSTATPTKRDEVIRFRAEKDLKNRIKKIAGLKKKKPAEFLRDAMWSLVEKEEKALPSRA